MALAWAVNAKNCLMNINGFSPHQLVFGQNIKLPNVFHDQISADNPETKTVREHISALHAAGKALINAETSDKLLCALCKQVQKTRQYYEISDIVYYKCNIDDKWKRPAKLLVKMVQLYFYSMEDSSSKPTVTAFKPITYMMKQVVL